MERRSGAPYFLYAALRVLEVIEVIWSIDRESLAFLYTAMRVLKVIKAERYIDC
jgi:hypothetical protein